MKGKKQFRKIREFVCLLLAAVLIFGTVPIEPAFASASETTEGTEELTEAGGTASGTQTDGEDQEEGSVSESGGEDPGSEETEPVEDAETKPEPEPEPAANNEAATYTNSISGVLWIDVNEDGTYDGDEQPLADHPVYLYVESDTENAVQTAVTDANGIYMFENIEPGSRYIVGIKVEENVTEYLLPLCGIQKDNKFYFAPDWSKVISNSIDIAADSVVEDINAAMRMMPQIQPMMNTTYTIDITNSTTVTNSITSQSIPGVSISSNVLTFNNTVDSTDTYILTGTTTTVRVVVDSGVTANITLDGVDIRITGGYPFRLLGTAIINLTLNGTNTLASTTVAGIHVPPDAALTITGTMSDTLHATGGTYGAGIGGAYINSVSAADNGAGIIIINGGTINATGGAYGAGIGGGGYTNNTAGPGGNVTINGGIITAVGGACGAGIGGGGGNTLGGSGGTLTINAGTVTATGGTYGAGIGGGGSGTNSGGGTGGIGARVTITGGTVHARGTYGAGIGGGAGGTSNASSGYTQGGSGDYVMISDGAVTATSTGCGAGIGGGGGYYTSVIDMRGGAGGTIHITGGRVTANGSYGGAGIGGGGNNRYVNGTALAATAHGGNITIDGGTVVATAATNVLYFAGGAGIGGGGCPTRGAVHAGSGGTITINGGDVTATGGTGIGGGDLTVGYVYNTGTAGSGGSGGTITINGGTVRAQGTGGGAGIGGGQTYRGGDGSTTGYAGSGGVITINGGDVTAIGGNDTYTSINGYGLGIGGGAVILGGTAGAAGNITITGGRVTATSGYASYPGIGSTRNVGTIIFTGGSIYPTNASGTVSVYPAPTNGSNGAPDPVGMITFPGYSSGDAFSIMAGGTVSSYLYEANAHPDGNVYAWLVYPGVRTEAATNVTANSATMNGTYYMNGTAISSAYFEWGTSTSYGNMEMLTTPTNVTSGNIESVSDSLAGLSSNTTYHYRLVIEVGSVKVPGNDMTFTTKPVVDTLNAAPTGSSTATVSGTIAAGNATISDVIITYATDAGFTTNVVTLDGSSGVTFTDTTYTANITGLTSGQIYYVKAEAVGPGGTSDAKTISFLAGGYPVTEKFVGLNGSAVDAAGLPDNTVVVTGSYTASGIPTSHTAGGNTYTYLGYKLDSYTAGDTLISGTPSSVTITGSRDVYYVYAIQVDLTISNTITGAYGDPNKAFEVTITLENSGAPVIGTYSYTGAAISGVTAPANGSITFDAAGQGTIALKHGQTITIKDILQGYTYTVEETDGAVTVGIYTAAYSGTGTVSGPGDSISETLGSTTAAVSITNDRSTIPASGLSGTDHQLAAVGILTVLAAALAVLWSYRRKRKCQ